MILVKSRKILIVMVIAILGACGERVRDWDPTDYTVQSGDTVYSIAWRYEIDPADLARWNNLSSPDTIRPGQRLHTRPPSSQPGTTLRHRPVPVPPPDDEPSRTDTLIVERGDTLYSLAREHGLTVAELAAANGLIKPYVIVPGQRLKIEAGRPVPATARRAPAPATSGKISWAWPVQGQIIGRFNRHKLDAKGIDISGKEGDRVITAAAGKVVYSGNGLINYGNLVIIKHNSAYLSAYAHNRKLLVKEGEQVSAGQAIAELGRSGTDRPRLHFEIRKNGKPVDPLRYLPGSTS